MRIENTQKHVLQSQIHTQKTYSQALKFVFSKVSFPISFSKCENWSATMLVMVAMLQSELHMGNEGGWIYVCVREIRGLRNGGAEMKKEEKSVDYVEWEGEIVRRETDAIDIKRKKKVQMKNLGKDRSEKGFPPSPLF